MTTNRKTKRRLVRLYIDVSRNRFWKIPFADARTSIEIPVPLGALRKAKRGYPFECWIAKAIMAYVKAHPKAFPHAVHHAYVLRGAIYLVDRVNGTPAHAVRYFHDFGSKIRKFDKLSRKAFLEFLDGKDPVLKMRPAVKGGHREPINGGRAHGLGAGTERNLDALVSRGALARAIDAKLELPAAAF